MAMIPMEYDGGWKLPKTGETLATIIPKAKNIFVRVFAITTVQGASKIVNFTTIFPAIMLQNMSGEQWHIIGGGYWGSNTDTFCRLNITSTNITINRCVINNVDYTSSATIGFFYDD